MTAALHEVLEQRLGVDEGDFTAALVDFVDRVGPLALVDIRPEDHFGDRQRAALRRVGASLRPLASGEVGAVAAFAAATAELVGTSLTVPQVAERLRVDPSRVRQRLHARSLYGFKHRGAWRVPSFQFQGRKSVPGLDEAVRALPPSLHPVAASRWFTTPTVDLELDGEAVSPLAWLAAGGSPERAANLASGLDRL